MLVFKICQAWNVRIGLVKFGAETEISFHLPNKLPSLDRSFLIHRAPMGCGSTASVMQGVHELASRPKYRTTCEHYVNIASHCDTSILFLICYQH